MNAGRCYHRRSDSPAGSEPESGIAMQRTNNGIRTDRQHQLCPQIVVHVERSWPSAVRTATNAVISSPPLSSRCLKHWWMDHFWRRSRKVYRSKHQRDQQCSNCHDDTETGANTCRLSLDYLNTPADLIYLVL